MIIYLIEPTTRQETTPQLILKLQKIFFLKTRIEI